MNLQENIDRIKSIMGVLLEITHDMDINEMPISKWDTDEVLKVADNYKTYDEFISNEKGYIKTVIKKLNLSNTLRNFFLDKDPESKKILSGVKTYKQLGEYVVSIFNQENNNFSLEYTITGDNIFFFIKTDNNIFYNEAENKLKLILNPFHTYTDFNIHWGQHRYGYYDNSDVTYKTFDRNKRKNIKFKTTQIDELSDVEVMDDLIAHLNTQYNSSDVTFTYKKYKNSNHKIFISVDTENSSFDYKKLFDESNKSIDHYLRFRFTQDQSLSNFFYKNTQLFFDRNTINNFKKYNNLNLTDDIKFSDSFIYDYNGTSSPSAEKVIKSSTKGSTLNSTINSLIKKIEDSCDLPLKVNHKMSSTGKTLMVEILPQLSLEDFMSCKYREFKYTNLSLGYKSLEYYTKQLFNLGVDFKYNVIWPQPIGHFITKLNKDLRKKLSQAGFSGYIDFGACVKKSNVLIGGVYNDSDENSFNRTPDNVKMRTAKNIVDSILKGAKINETTPYDVYDKYKDSDMTYWDNKRLFDFFVKKSKSKHGSKYNYNIKDFIGLNNDVTIFCKQHNEYFTVNAKKHMNGLSCPYDNESKGERMVRIYLEENNISYDTQYRLKKCFSELNGKCYTLPFDFYLKEKNILIEYDGLQHFKPVNIFGGEESFKRRLELDRIKNQFAKDNNIKLIRIKYTYNTQNKINQVLDRLL